MGKSGLAFHVHHDRLYEYCYDYDERVKFIKENKPKEEQELRLRLFKLIPADRVPGQDSKEYEACTKAMEACIKAREAYDKAREACTKAMEACIKAREAYYKAREAYYKAMAAYYKAHGDKLLKLHEELCPNCTWNGRSIFKEEE